MQSRHKNNQQVYTDGSKEDSKDGFGVISDNHCNMQRIPDDSSIFTAEAKAVGLALYFAFCIESYEPYQFKESTDSELLEKCQELLTIKEIVLCWIPSHIGILVDRR